MTRAREFAQRRGHACSPSPDEVRAAYDHGEVDLQAQGRRAASTASARRPPSAACCSRDRAARRSASTPINKVLDKKQLGEPDRPLLPAHRREGDRAPGRPPPHLGYTHATRAGISICIKDMIIPPKKQEFLDDARKEVAEIENQYHEGLITDGERYNKVIDIWAEVTEKIAARDDAADLARGDLGRERGRQARDAQAALLQPDLHHGRLGARGSRAADPPAGRHARPDGQALGRDHRDADHRELPRGPVGAAVLHLDPRRAQGPGRHGAQDRQLRLPDPPPGRRGAGRDHHRVRLRHHGRHR